MKLTQQCIMAAAVGLAVLGLGGTGFSQSSAPLSGNTTADAAGKASAEQGEAIAKMADLIKKFGPSDAVAIARARIVKDIAEQGRLQHDAETLSPLAAGKKPENLPPEVKQRLEDLARRQAALSISSVDLIADMEKAKAELAKTAPADSEILDKVSDIGKTGDVAGTQQNAGTKFGQGQMTGGMMQQGRSMSSLNDMLDQINQINAKRLERLQRQLSEIIDLLRRMHRAEQLVFLDTQPLGLNGVQLGDRQQTIQMNALVILKRIQDTEDGEKAAGDLRDAGQLMAVAAPELYQQQNAAAIGPELGAVASIQAAIDKLKPLLDAATHEVAANDLAAIVKEYKEIRAGEQSLKDGSDQIETQRAAAADKQIDRRGTMELARLGEVQKKLEAHVATLSTDKHLADLEVVMWMNGQITDAMRTSEDAISKSQTGARLASAQTTAIDRLTSLIDALTEEQRQAKPFDTPPDSGVANRPPSSSGPQTGVPSEKLVSKLAQLKLVRAMQSVVNVQTTGVNNALKTAANDGEKSQLKQEAAKLGETQGELKRIVENLVQEIQ